MAGAMAVAVAVAAVAAAVAVADAVMVAVTVTVAVAVVEAAVGQWRRIAGGRVPKCPPVKNAGRQNGRFCPPDFSILYRLGLVTMNNFLKQTSAVSH